jgi:XamI restriction endonuclease
MPRPPERWNDAELRADAKRALELHVRQRRAAVAAEHAEYRKLVERFTDDAVELLARTNDLRDLSGQSIKHRATLNIARYAAVPLISTGDLDNLTSAAFGTWLKQKSDRGARPSDAEFEEAAAVIAPSLNPLLAPWLTEGRDPTRAERRRFAITTALVPAASAVETFRRSSSAERQEKAIRAACAAASHKPVKPPGKLTDPINDMEPGSYSESSRKIAGDNMDVPVRLKPGHFLKFLAIEAKVSNTAVNSRKRLAEVMNKRNKWDNAGLLYDFRTAAVLAGDFSVERLREAQEAGVMIFWEHRLDDLNEFLKP